MPEKVEIKNPAKRQLVAGEQSITSKRKKDNLRNSDEKNQFQEYLDELSEPPIQTAPDEAYGFPLPKTKIKNDRNPKNSGLNGSES